MDSKTQLKNVLRKLEELDKYEKDNESSGALPSARECVANELDKVLTLHLKCHSLKLNTNIESIGSLSLYYYYNNEHHHNDLSSLPQGDNTEDYESSLLSSQLYAYQDKTTSGINTYDKLAEDLDDIDDDPNFKCNTLVIDRLFELFNHLKKELQKASIDLQEYTKKCLLYDKEYYASHRRNSDTMDSILETIDSSQLLGIRHPLLLQTNKSIFHDIYTHYSKFFETRHDLQIEEVASRILQEFEKICHISIFHTVPVTVKIIEYLTTKENGFHDELTSLEIERNDLVDNQRRSEKLYFLNDVVQVLSELLLEVDVNFATLFKAYYANVHLYPELVDLEDVRYIDKVFDLIDNVLGLGKINWTIPQFLDLQNRLTKPTRSKFELEREPGLKPEPEPELELKMKLESELEANLSLALALALALVEGQEPFLLTDLMRLTSFRVSSIYKVFMNIWLKRLRNLPIIEWDRNDSLVKKICQQWQLKAGKLILCNLEAQQYHNSKLQSTYLKRLMLVSTKRRAQELQANINYMQNIFRIWLMKAEVEHKKNQAAIEMDQTILLKSQFNEWRNMAQTHSIKDKEMLRLCSFFQTNSEQILLKQCWQMWKMGALGDTNHNLLEKKLEEYIQMKLQAQKAKFFRRWLKLHQMNTDCTNFEKLLLMQSLNKFWTIWAYKTKRIQDAKKLASKLAKTSMIHILKKWQTCTSFAAKADAYRHKYIKESVIKQWRLATRLKNFKLKQAERLRLTYFRIWISTCTVKLNREMKNYDTVGYFFHKLKAKAAILAKNKQKAELHYNLKLTSKYIHYMEEVLRRKQQQTLDVKLLAVKRFFDKWKHETNRIGQLADQQFCEQYILRKNLIRWHDRLQMNIESRLQPRVDHFVYLQQWLISRKYLKKLRQTFMNRELNAQQLEVVAVEFNNVNTLRSILNFWVSKLELQWNMQYNAINFVSIDNTQYWFNRWLSKHFAQVELESMAIDLEDQNLSSKARGYIQRWHFNYQKSIRRHKQMVDDFREKSNGKTLAAFMDLWMLKSKLRAGKHEDQDQFDMSNTSFGSNTSPLTKRNQLQMERQMTPEKRFALKRTSTPQAKQPSPTRLQETTLRRKTQQTLSLSDRLSKVRLLPRASKIYNRAVPIRLDYNVSLSPPAQLSPKKPTSPKGMPQLLPNDENFDESSLVNTAKKMGRIQPIRFPTDDDNNEGGRIRFSPIGKLKRESDENVVL